MTETATRHDRLARRARVTHLGAVLCIARWTLAVVASAVVVAVASAVYHVTQPH